MASPKNATASTRPTVRETAPETGTVECSGALTSLLQVAEGDPSRADLADARLHDEQLLAVLPLRTQTGDHEKYQKRTVRSASYGVEPMVIIQLVDHQLLLHRTEPRMVSQLRVRRDATLTSHFKLQLRDCLGPMVDSAVQLS